MTAHFQQTPTLSKHDCTHAVLVEECSLEAVSLLLPFASVHVFVIKPVGQAKAV
jgi:hypothetical protein